MKIRYKLSLLLIGLMLIGCLYITQSYALWIVEKEQTNQNEVEVGCFSIGFSEQSESINLNNTYPMSDSLGLSSDPYTFTITNTCTINNSYVLTLNTLSTNTLDASKIKYALYKSTEEKPSVGSKLSRINNDIESLSIENLGTSYILDTGLLSGGTKVDEVVNNGEKVTYNLYLWIDEIAGNEVEGQNFEASINVINTAMDNSKMPAEEYIKRISTVENGDGLYKVSHNVSEINSDWNKTEYRYAGVNPNNYVKFNDEIWRIIGLVNVKTENGIEQRIKIVRTDGINGQKDFGGFSWDHKAYGIGSTNSVYGSNDWTDSQLKDMLNGIYYESKSGECWTGEMSTASVQSICDFNNRDDNSKGLDKDSKLMIDNKIIWTLGGSISTDLSTKEFYEKERGSLVYTEKIRQIQWTKENDIGNLYNGVGLLYPSDYGYSNGGSEYESCLTKSFYHYNETDCINSWLKPANDSLWTLTPYAVDPHGVINIYSDGKLVAHCAYDVRKAWPTLYLKSSVKIIENQQLDLEYGTISNPFVLEA